MAFQSSHTNELANHFDLTDAKSNAPQLRGAAG
jgi:hypothetical protein